MGIRTECASKLLMQGINLKKNCFWNFAKKDYPPFRYKLLAPFDQLSRNDDRTLEDCQLILDSFDNCVSSYNPRDRGNVSISWALGKRHIFLSEGARQQLEALRTCTRNRAATIIQSSWRGWSCRQRLPILKHQSRFSTNSNHHTLKEPEMSPPNPMTFTPLNFATLTRTHNSHSQNSDRDLKQGLGHYPSSQYNENPSPEQIPPPSSGPVSLPSSLSPPLAPPLPPPNGGAHTNSACGSVGSANSGGLRPPRPQPISGTPPPEMQERCDPKLVQQTCTLFGLDMVRKFVLKVMPRIWLSHAISTGETTPTTPQ